MHSPAWHRAKKKGTRRRIRENRRQSLKESSHQASTCREGNEKKERVKGEHEKRKWNGLQALTRPEQGESPVSSGERRRGGNSRAGCASTRSLGRSGFVGPCLVGDEEVIGGHGEENSEERISRKGERMHG